MCTFSVYQLCAAHSSTVILLRLLIREWPPLILNCVTLYGFFTFICRLCYLNKPKCFLLAGDVLFTLMWQFKYGSTASVNNEVYILTRISTSWPCLGCDLVLVLGAIKIFFSRKFKSHFNFEKKECRKWLLEES
jgi:hypothetical protein